MSTEELLIDFQELVGEHSGENLAHAVYDTLSRYGLQGHVRLRIGSNLCCTTSYSSQIIAINSDNASNNNTMVEHLGILSEEDNVEFRASDARLWCMPHTVHLAALEVLDKNFHGLCL